MNTQQRANRPSSILLLLACAALCACSSGSSSTTTTAGKPAKCTTQAGGLGIDKSADLQVFQESQQVESGSSLSVGGAALGTGQAADTTLRVLNGATLTSAAELRITSVDINYTPPAGAIDGATPVFECLVDVGGQMVPCKGHDFGSIVPAGFDPDCLSAKASDLARVVVRFTKPGDGLARQALLRIDTTGDRKWIDSNKNPKPFLVKIATTVGAPQIKLSPPQLDFSTVKIGLSSELTVTMLNVGDADLTITKLDVALDDGKAFSVRIGAKTYKGGQSATLDPPIVLAKDKSQQMAVIFSAIDGAKHADLIQIVSNDAKSPTLLPLIANQNVPCLKIEPSTKVNFGFVTIGAKALRTVKLTSCGDATLEVSQIALQNDPAGTFATNADALSQAQGKPVTAANPLKLEKNQSALVDVTCEPASENKDPSGKPGPFTAQIGFLDNTAQPGKKLALECYGSSSSCPTPVITVEEGEQIVPQQQLHLHGSQSFAAPSKKVAKWLWELTKKPDGAEGLGFYPNPNTADPAFGVKTDVKDLSGKVSTEYHVNVAGTYEFKLTVWDDAGNLNCQSATAVVLVVPDQGIHVELLWDTPGDKDKTDTGPSAGSDMDLHFANQAKFCSDPSQPCYAKTCQSPPEMCGAKPCVCQPDVDGDGEPDPWFHSLYDCFWFNPTPNWGSVVDHDDDPRLDLDDTDGWGPENLNLPSPENSGLYSVGVHFWDAHSFGASTATTRIYILGDLKATLVQPLNECDMWWVKRISWPSGDLIDVPGTPAGGNGKVTAKYKSTFAATLGGVCGK